MATERPPTHLVMADDISGACECAGILLDRGHAATVALGRSHAKSGAGPIIVDLDARRTPSATLTDADVSRMTFLKIDSLLRGPVASLVSAARSGGRVIVLCNAVPVLGRTVVDQQTRVGGVNLADTDHWKVESAPAPRRMADLLGTVGVTPLPLSRVRGPMDDLLADIAGATRGGIVSAEAETDGDLDRIVAAAAPSGALLVGAGGLFDAWARTLVTAEHPPPSFAQSPAAHVLAVVGSASTAAREQIAALDPRRTRTVTMTPAELVTGVVADELDSQRHPAEVLCISSEPWPRPAELSQALAGVAASRARPPGVALVLIGGETARNTLDALGARRLRALRAVHYGAIVCLTDDDRTVIVRPGSFGSRDALADLIHAAHGA